MTGPFRRVACSAGVSPARGQRSRLRRHGRLEAEAGGFLAGFLAVFLPATKAIRALHAWAGEVRLVSFLFFPEGILCVGLDSLLLVWGDKWYNQLIW